MSQHPCWNEVDLHRILKPDAEEIADEVFRAVHCTTELQIAETADGPRTVATPSELVERFLDPHRDYVQTVVLGESGTGKSHLIQWLRLHIPHDDNTVMLTIPKTGTSLRGIVTRLIKSLPEDERQPYEERLQQAGTQTASQDAKVKKFLSELAWAIEHSGLATGPEEVDLAALLPSVLLDPNFRQGFFLVPGRAVDLIVQHVFVDPDKRDGNAERREFSLGDLPLDGRNYKDASKPAQEAIDYIKGEAGMEARAIDLMNRNRDAAIAQTLNFSADHLIDLMNALRRYLERKGKRLILLIEDFARLQGIDTALLQALITPPGQGDERLCELRWAMAVTTGYFKNLALTVRGRTTLLVDMDLSKPASLSRLTAGYLNALRLGESQLRSLSMIDDTPSRCVTCEKNVSCLGAFGSVEGIGLFPFTETSIDVMARRTESLSDGGQFNPRKYLRSVLEVVLKQGFSDLEHDEFPSDVLLSRVGGANALRPIDRQSLQQADGLNFSRRNTLLELWDGTGRILNLPTGVHEAFGLPMLRDVAAATTDPTPDPRPDPPAPGTNREVAIVRRWANDGTKLPQNAVNELRQLVFSALESFIDWDKLGYKKAAVASAVGPMAIPFRQVSINFRNQETNQLPSLVMLELLPTDAPALEALLMYKHHRNWNFPDSGLLFANLLEALRVWAIDVENQLMKLYSGQADWNPIGAAVELLLVASYQGDRVKVGDISIETVVVKLWETTPPKTIRCLHRPFAELNGRIVSQWPKILELLRNLSSGTKGGNAGNFVRVTPVLRAVRSLRQRSLKLVQNPPLELPSEELRKLAELYRRTQMDFESCFEAEKSLRRAWLSNVLQSIGEGTKFSDLIEALREAAENVMKNGINAGISRSNLNETLKDIVPSRLDKVLDHARAIDDASAGDALLRIASIGDNGEKIDELIARAEAFLQNAEAGTANEKARYEQQGGVGLQQSDQRIEQSLDQLSASLDSLYQLPGEGT
jgi:hypothetical protein